MAKSQINHSAQFFEINATLSPGSAPKARKAETRRRALSATSA
ncbi:Uncharacterised protein [Vibrio cholerae]|nr:Uncharacterised protein [Vibrio cholerae]